MKTPVLSLALSLLMLTGCPPTPTQSESPTTSPTTADAAADKPKAAASPETSSDKETSPTDTQGPNRRPIIKSLTASPNHISVQDGKLTFTVAVEEPDGDKLDIKWSVSSGQILEENQTEMVWQPKDTSGQHQKGLTLVKVIASDPQGLEDAGDLNIWIDDTIVQALSSEGSSSDVLGIDIAADSILLALNETKAINANVVMADGSSRTDLNWSSDHPDRVQVDAKGNITRVASGTAEITITTPLNTILASRVRILDPDNTSLTDIQPGSAVSGAPSNLSVDNALPRSAFLSWAPVSGAQSYRVYLDQTLHRSDITNTNYTLDNLSPETAYQIQVSAISAAGESALSSAVAFSTPAELPATPSGLKVSNATTTTLNLQWNPVSGAQSYRLYHDGTLIADNLTSPNFTWTDRSVNTAYSLQVSAVNSIGESDKSLPVLARTLVDSAPFSGTIFYGHREPNGAPTLYRLTSGSEPQALLTTPPNYESYPAATSNGQTILYSSPVSGDHMMYKLTLSTGKSKQVSLTRAWRGDISKDGTSVLIAGTPSLSEKEDIFISDINGGNQQRLAPHEAFDSFPAFSPDGQHIAFMSLRDGQYEIYTMNTDGSDLSKITNQNNLKESHLEWTSSGSQLYCLTKDNRIQLLTLSSGALTPLPGMEGFSLNIKDIALSPDQSQIAFTGSVDGVEGLYLTNISNFDPIFLTPSSEYALDWSN